MRIELSIGEVVLHGFAAGERAAIGEALARELERRLAEPGVAQRIARAGSRPAIATEALRLPSGPARRVGADVAGAVARALGGTRSRGR
jgi:hypothetical protein